MTLVVADAGPLIHLGAAGKLHLLWDLYGDDIIIPPAVYHEVVVRGRGKPGAAEVAAAIRAGHIRVVAVQGRAALAVTLQGAGLGQGEAEAIALAVQERASRLCIIERRGYRISQQYSPRHTTINLLEFLDECEAAGTIRSARDELLVLLAAGYAPTREHFQVWCVKRGIPL
jgi:uncharacterized protein